MVVLGIAYAFSEKSLHDLGYLDKVETNIISIVLFFMGLGIVALAVISTNKGQTSEDAEDAA